MIIRHNGHDYRVYLSKSGDSVEVLVPGSGPRVMRAAIPERWRTVRPGGPTHQAVVKLARAASLRQLLHDAPAAWDKLVWGR